MKHSIKILGKVMAMVLFFFLVAGCKKKDCSATVCGYNQVCNSGNCYCRDGYEGDSCNILSYPNYVGNYNVSYSCNGAGSGIYPCYIAHNSSDPSILEVSNFLNYYTFYAQIKGATDKKGNNVYVSSQTLIGGNGTTDIIEGTGTLDHLGNGQTRINFQFNYHYNNQDYACTHTFIK